MSFVYPLQPPFFVFPRSAVQPPFLGGTRTGSYQTGSYQKGRFIPPKPKLSALCFLMRPPTATFFVISCIYDYGFLLSICICIRYHMIIISYHLIGCVLFYVFLLVLYIYIFIIVMTLCLLTPCRHLLCWVCIYMHR